MSSDRVASEDITVVANTVSLSAQGGGVDFADVIGQTLTIAAGSQSTTLTVNVDADVLVEDDETFEVVLSDPKFDGNTDASRVTIADGTGVGTIVNDGATLVTVDNTTFAEGNSGTTTFTFNVSLSRVASQDITVVAKTLGVTATGGGVDFDDVTNQLVTITAGTLSSTVTVDVIGELIVENDETFEIKLTDAKYKGVTDTSRVIIDDDTGVGTIVNDDTASISISDSNGHARCYR